MERRLLMPLPFSLNTVPGWVPGGTLYLIFSSSVGTTISSPRAACSKEIGMSSQRSVPFLSKSLSDYITTNNYIQDTNCYISSSYIIMASMYILVSLC